MVCKMMGEVWKRGGVILDFTPPRIRLSKFLAINGRCHPGHLMENGGEMAGGGELQLFTDFQNADMRVGQKDICIADSFFQNVLVDAGLMFLFETPGQVVFGIAKFLGERVQVDFFRQMSVNIIHAFPNKGVVNQVLFGLVNPVDKVVTHGRADLLDFRNGGGGLNGLDVVVAARIGVFRRVAAADGGTGDKSRIDNHLVLRLTKRVAGAHGAALHKAVGSRSGG